MGGTGFVSQATLAMARVRRSSAPTAAPRAGWRVPSRAGVGWAVALALAAASGSLRAGLLNGNIWLNPSLESVSIVAGIPTGWHLGGSDPTIDTWATDESVSPTHSLKLNDTSENDYGEWYSDRIAAYGNSSYSLRYNLRYDTVGTMRLTVNFADAAGTALSAQSFNFSGSQLDWLETDQSFIAPEGTTAMWFTFASGGAASTTGTAWLDDLSLVNETGQPVGTSKAKILDAAYAPNLKVDGNPGDWAGLSSTVLTMDTQGRGAHGTMAVDIRYAWDATHLYLLVTEDTNKFTTKLKQEAANADAFQAGPWSVDSIGFWLDLDNDAGTTVDGTVVVENNADFQPWFGFSSSGRTDLMYARVNNSGSMNLDGLANAKVATSGTFAQHNRVIEVALQWADMAASADPSRQPGGDLTQAIKAGFTLGSEPLLVYYDYNSQSFLGPDQWNPGTGVDEYSCNVRLVENQVAPPRLTVRSAGGGVLVQWPATASGFGLQTSAQLGGAAAWSAVGVSPTVDPATGSYQATLPVSAQAAFYRLRK